MIICLQVNLIWKKLRLESLKGIKVLTSYQMQGNYGLFKIFIVLLYFHTGQEFDVLFLSTVESITSDGTPFDPLKSFCDPAVFNTAMTRARSLIVAVGEPERLRTAERALNSSYGCWNKFINKCQENNTYRLWQADTYENEKEAIVERKPLILNGM